MLQRPRPASPIRIDAVSPSSSDIHRNLCPNAKLQRQGYKTFLFRTIMAAKGDSPRDRSLLGSNQLGIAAQLNDRRKQGTLVVAATWAFCLLTEAPPPPQRSPPLVLRLRQAPALPPLPFALEGLPYPVLPCAPRLSAHFGRRFRFDGRKKSAPPKEGQRGFLSNKEPDRDYSSNVPFTTISPSRII